MDKEKIIVIVVIALVAFAVIYATGIVNINTGKKAGNVNAGGNSGNIPEECKQPAGQDLNAWKEHLGHHENTKYCLQYFK